MSDQKSADKPLDISNPEITDEQAKSISDKTVIDPASLTAADLDNFLAWKRKKTGESLNSQPKVPLYIPFREGEDRNNQSLQYAFFGVNGYYVLVKKGIMVEVPRQIAEMWVDSGKQSQTADEFLLGNISMKIDPVTGGRKDVARLVG